MTKRELARLVPLLALYVVLLAVLPGHPDDEASYRILAERLAQGAYVGAGDDALLDQDPAAPDLWFGPGLPLALAPLAGLDVPIEVMRLSGPLFLFAAMVIFYVLLRERWGARRALAVTYAVGLYPPFWPLLTNLHSEVLAVLFVTVAMLGISRSLRFRKHGSFLLAVAGLAGLALTRVAYGWVMTAALLVFLVRWLLGRYGAGRMVGITAAALVVCSPWLAYTHAQTDRFPVWGNSGALSLYWMASPHDGDTGDWRQANDVFTDPGLAPHRPFFSSLRGLSLTDQNREIEREALRNIAEHPLSYLGNVGANAARMIANWPYSDSDWEPNDLLYAVSNLALLAVVAFSLVVLIPRRRALPIEAGPFAILAGLGLGLHVALSAYPRMLTPIIPIVGWFAALAIAEWGRGRSAGVSVEAVHER